MLSQQPFLTRGSLDSFGVVWGFGVDERIGSVGTNLLFLLISVYLLSSFAASFPVCNKTVLFYFYFSFTAVVRAALHNKAG